MMETSHMHVLLVVFLLWLGDVTSYSVAIPESVARPAKENVIAVTESVARPAKENVTAVTELVARPAEENVTAVTESVARPSKVNVTETTDEVIISSIRSGHEGDSNGGKNLLPAAAGGTIKAVRHDCESICLNRYGDKVCCDDTPPNSESTRTEH